MFSPYAHHISHSFTYFPSRFHIVSIISPCFPHVFHMEKKTCPVPRCLCEDFSGCIANNLDFSESTFRGCRFYKVGNVGWKFNLLPVNRHWTLCVYICIYIYIWMYMTNICKSIDVPSHVGNTGEYQWWKCPSFLLPSHELGFTHGVKAWEQVYLHSAAISTNGG